MQNKLTHRFLIKLEEAQLVRELRNDVRRYMTRNNDFINPRQQENWFHQFRNDVDNQHMHLFYSSEHCFVGYCYLKRDLDGKLWGSLAVKPEFQGLGHGSYIYRYMIETYGTVFIEIFVDNDESLRAATRSGFQTLSVGDRTVTMKGTRREVYTV